MPPVLGPVSPSPTRLWSFAVPKGIAVLPRAEAEDAGLLAVMNSSTTTSAPAPPKAPERSRVDGRKRLVERHRDVTPLPAASPSALTTIGAPHLVDIGARGCGNP